MNTPEPHPGGDRRTLVSVVMPAFNEADNLKLTIPEMLITLDDACIVHEIIVVDDGSDDDTPSVLRSLSDSDSRIRPIRLRRNVGKAAALQAGIAAATGDIVVFCDADGQDDPREIPRLVALIEAGTADLVSGRRSNRQDRLIKRWTSRVYNLVTGRVTGVPGSDFNSSLKVLTRDVAESLHLYGELHRYIPIFAHGAGYRIAEIDVVHRARIHGRSKFGRSRFLRGLLDLLTARFLTAYDARPLHLFGSIGLVCGAAGSGLLIWMLALKVSGQAIGDRPALLAGVVLILVALQLISLGLLAELIVHVHRDIMRRLHDGYAAMRIADTGSAEFPRTGEPDPATSDHTSPAQGT